MGSQSQETFDHQVLELLEELGAVAAKHVNVFLSQLECHRLKIQVTWAVGKEEPKVHMDHVSLGIEQNVSVVAILDL